MRPIRHLRIPAPRWPSKDPRDYRTAGALTAWRARRTQAPVLPPRDHPPGPARPPAVCAIVGLRRVDAMLHVELVARSAALDGGPKVLARGRTGAARGGGGPDDQAGADGEARTWSWTLPLN